MEKYKVGDKVRLLSDGMFLWDVSSAKGNTYKTVYGKYFGVSESGAAHRLLLFSKKNNELISLSENRTEKYWTFHDSEIEPYDKPINPIRRFINAIIGWFCDPDSHSVNRYN